jgi:hypothetical protein
MKTVYLIILLFSFSCCENLKSDRDYPIYLNNLASYSVQTYLALGDGYATTVYPDTTLPQNNVFIDKIIKSNEKVILYNSHLKWEEIYKTFLPADTLSVFIFHTDTLNKYTWDEVRNGYKVLKRYDLSLDDLKQMNWTITYP